MIERIETAYYRLPLEPSGDAGHGAIDYEELITVRVSADGLTGEGYAYRHRDALRRASARAVPGLTRSQDENYVRRSSR